MQEIKKQQQLQLLDRSPAPRNVRQLLARAAADNTALARKVEELRAQRNALAVTKAALTAQLSELIRGAADGAQNNTQHKVLLQQLHQLCSYIGLHRLQDPAQQMAAVLQYVQEARQGRQQLHGEMSQVQDPSAATTEASLLLSPTGRQLDQTATSQLVWDTSQCVELFPPGHPQGAAAANATPGSAASTVVELGSAWSRRTDLSYLSPLRSSGAAKQQRSPSSSTPVPLQAAGGGGSASPAPARELALDFSPIVGRHAGSSGGRSGVWGDGDGPRCFSFEPADEADEEEQQQEQQGQVTPSRRRWWLAVGLCTVVPLTLVAAAGGAAWRFKRDEVQELAAALKLGARVAAQQTRSAASAGWRQCQLSTSAVRARAQRLMQRGSASTHAGSGGYDDSDVHVAAAVPQS
ncbi:hypothetical protein OEZ85_008763 [Tetradesmus obliquus]|uniref:Uncharacterized protein n=1 Tax=Tetradesmus obliquus TaxID=3088 RepID=A0ABY8TJQ7_TETOB|nr:hypothetical protein OEZ85_008763 [Tetradesmus obliquus]